MIRRTALLAVPLAAGIAGCAGSSSSSSPSGTSAPGGTVHGTVVVSAAASLKEAFTTLAESFQKAHPETKVTLNFGGSDTLAAQITGGAPVDVFAAASTTTMDQVTAAKDASGSPAVFARNKLEIAVPPSNPGHIHGFADSARPGVKLVLCEPTVPCGAAAAKAYTAAGLAPTPASLEPDVKSVLTKVELREADAGIVYQTDVRAAGSKVNGIPFAEADHALATYPIVAVRTGGNASGGAAFVAYVLSPDGASVLHRAGFLGP